MTIFEKWWTSIVRRNSGFGQDDSTIVTMTIGVVKKLTKRAHDDGFNCGIQTHPPKPQSPYADVIKDIIGK